jgi:DNA-binding NarL/FixJ family response regulator
MSILIEVAEPQRLVRDSFAALLRTQADFEVVGDAGEAAAALSLAAACSPNVVLLDVSLVAGDHSLLRALAGLPSAPRIIVDVGADTWEGLLMRPPAEPLAGMVCKDDPADEVFTAIRLTAAGRSYVTPRVAEAAARAQNGEHAYLRKLTPREQEVFDLVLRGDSTAGIARRLLLSPRTVESHRSHVMRKLGVRSTVDLVRVAARNGLLPR